MPQAILMTEATAKAIATELSNAGYEADTLEWDEDLMRGFVPAFYVPK